MGKEYITDTVTLEGDITFDVITQTQSKITQINFKDLAGDRENFFTKHALSCQTTIAEAAIDPSAITTISIGGFENSVGANPFIIETANKIKIYTGEKPSKNKILIYQGKERFTIDKRGYVGINNPNIDTDNVTFDVRSTTALAANPETAPKLEAPIIALTHPYYNRKGDQSSTPEYIGGLQFRSIQRASEVGKQILPTDMAGILVETNGEANVYEDARVNLSLSTATGEDGSLERPRVTKHLEINGYEKKTKIFTQLNLGNVPVFRDQTEAVEQGKLVNGDVYQDREQNLKIVFLLQKEV